MVALKPLMDTEADPLARYDQSAKNRRVNHVEPDAPEADWLGRTGVDATKLLKIERLIHEHRPLYVAAWEAALDEEARGILAVITWQDGAGYALLTEWLPRASRRSLERKVARLKEAGLVVGEGKPVTFHHASPAAALLTEHVLALTDGEV